MKKESIDTFLASDFNLGEAFLLYLVNDYSLAKVVTVRKM